MTGKCLANQTVPRGNHMPKDISCNEPYSGNTADQHIFALTLWDIASWQITDKTLSEQKASFRPENLKGQTGIHAGLPTLQRGAVWRARQIELFWDSLLRSFPVGSLLLAKKITGQDTRPSPVTGSAPEASYHILDGQQRSNAIAWGFYLPEQPEKNGKGKYTFPPTEDTAGKNKAAKSMLWLDLMPFDPKSPPRTSRKYLFRLTTTAHPWGYSVDDNASRLPYQDIENFRKTYDKVVSSSNEGSGNKTYHVHASVPQKAVMPIPMGLLMKYAKNSTNGISIDWTNLLRNPWIAFIDDWLTCRNEINKDSSVTLSKWLEDHQEKIIKWLSPLPHIIIPAINCSTGLYDENNENSNVDNAALIFERINNQGSPINQEELQYSLIKAYFPAVEKTINHIEEKQKGLPTGEARLVRLGVRAALLTVKPANNPGREILPYKEKQLFTHIETKTIRSWFKGENKEQNVISAYFNKKDASNDSNDCLFKAIEWIENQLVYRHNGKKEPYTLHPYLRSSIAWSSPDVYLWWMLLAEAFNYGELDASEKKRILAISTVIHWFGYKKSDLVNDLIKEIRRKQNDNTPVEIDAFKLPQPGTDNNLMAFLAPPDALLDALGKGLNARFREASEGKSPLHAYNPAFFLTDERAQSYRDIVSILSQETELLVYVQRDYLAELAVGYDPSQRSLWENHNRPWDYDHIVPSDFFNGTGSSKSDFIKAYYLCKCLQQSIGNQTALSFSENRSKNNKSPSSLSDEYWSNAFCYTKKSPDDKSLDELKAGFTCEKNDFRTSPKNSGNAANDKAKAFAEAALNRMIGIYRKWYDDLGVRDVFDTSSGS